MRPGPWHDVVGEDLRRLVSLLRVANDTDVVLAAAKAPLLSRNCREGLLVQISVSGMEQRFNSPARWCCPTVASCTVRLSVVRALQGTFEIRHVRCETDSEVVDFCGRFLDLNPRHRDTLAEFITELEAA